MDGAFPSERGQEWPARGGGRGGGMGRTGFRGTAENAKTKLCTRYDHVHCSAAVSWPYEVLPVLTPAFDVGGWLESAASAIGAISRTETKSCATSLPVKPKPNVEATGVAMEVVVVTMVAGGAMAEAMAVAG